MVLDLYNKLKEFEVQNEMNFALELLFSSSKVCQPLVLCRMVGVEEQH